MISQPVFLIGFMGVGKTTLGKKLARALEVEFVDSDAALEDRFGCSIAEYFEKKGEHVFRLMEHLWLKELTDSPKVIATGGGMPCFYANIELMNQKGVTIYLKRSAKELHHRLINAKQQRPLIQELKEEELLIYIEQKIKEREQFYLKAKHVLNREEQEPKVIMELLS